MDVLTQALQTKLQVGMRCNLNCAINSLALLAVTDSTATSGEVKAYDLDMVSGHITTKHVVNGKKCATDTIGTACCPCRCYVQLITEVICMRLS